MITTLKKLRCCCTSLYRADAVRYGMIMMMLVVGLLSTAQPAAAQSGLSGQACIKEKTGLNNPSCTANDVRIGSFELLAGPATCDPTDPTPIVVTLRAHIESGPARYDIGLWVNQAGNSAKTDTTGSNCYRDFFPPPLSSTLCDQLGGDYFDADGDSCGDVYAVGTNPCGNASTGPCTGGGGGTCLFSTFDFTVSIVCKDSNGDGTADVGSCTSWDNNTAGVCSGVLGTDPGTGAKCNCGTTNILGLHTGCSVDLDCNDDNACTTDTCSVVAGVGTCTNTDISSSCDDGNECTADSCDPATGCVNTDNSARCNDNNECTADSCVPATGCVNTDNSARCDDGNECTADSCVPATGCVNTDNSARCNDNNACTTDSCVPATGCVNTDNSARCDDGNVCTADRCDPTDGCHNEGSCAVDTQIAPTATTCLDYTSGTAADLNELLYGLKGGAINSVSPGVLFLYDTFHLGATGTVSVDQTDGTWTQFLAVHQGQVILYDLSCNKLNVGTVSVNGSGDVTIAGVPAGDYVLGIKYDPNTLKGYSPPTPIATFTFTVMAGGAPSGSDSIDVKPKP